MFKTLTTVSDLQSPINQSAVNCCLLLNNWVYTVPFQTSMLSVLNMVSANKSISETTIFKDRSTAKVQYLNIDLLPKYSI